VGRKEQRYANANADAAIGLWYRKQKTKMQFEKMRAGISAEDTAQLVLYNSYERLCCILRHKV
jgi:hypothetical protein